MLTPPVTTYRVEPPMSVGATYHHAIATTTRNAVADRMERSRGRFTRAVHSGVRENAAGESRQCAVLSLPRRPIAYRLIVTEPEPVPVSLAETLNTVAPGHGRTVSVGRGRHVAGEGGRGARGRGRARGPVDRAARADVESDLDNRTSRQRIAGSRAVGAVGREVEVHRRDVQWPSWLRTQCVELTVAPLMVVWAKPATALAGPPVMLAVKAAPPAARAHDRSNRSDEASFLLRFNSSDLLGLRIGPPLTCRSLLIASLPWTAVIAQGHRPCSERPLSVVTADRTFGLTA